MKNPILFAIVTYKEQYFECLSFISLVRSFSIYGEGKLNVFIYDNTDIDNWKVEKNEISDVKVNYVHQKDNPGISFAYNRINDFAFENKFQCVVFLDQDTTLPIETYKVYSENTLRTTGNFTAVPTVLSNKKIISPSRYLCYRSILFNKIDKNVLNFKYVSCINTGLMVDVGFFKSVGGYNEKLKLDFCDHDFIEKVKKTEFFLDILPLTLTQDFSADINTKLQALNRYKIFVADLKQFSTNRSAVTLFLFVDIPHLLKLMYKYQTIFFYKIRFFSKL
jgi:hypothetical protein